MSVAASWPQLSARLMTATSHDPQARGSVPTVAIVKSSARRTDQFA